MWTITKEAEKKLLGININKYIQQQQQNHIRKEHEETWNCYFNYV